MNAELEKLLKIALADGILTDKERSILLRKAESLGVDPDEFEMFIEGKLSELQKNKQSQIDNPINESKKDSNPVIKCPSCNDIIPPLSKICPSCNYAMDATSKENKDSLEVLIKKVEDCIILIKTYHKTSFINTFKRQLGLLILLIGVLFFTFTILKLRTVDWGILFFVLSIITVIAGIITLIAYRPGRIAIDEDNENDEETDYSYDGLNAEIDKYLRVLKSLYGEEQKVKAWLAEFNNEISVIKTTRKKKGSHYLILYGVYIAISLILFIIPAAKSDYEISMEIKNAESSIVSKAELLISEKKFDEVEDILSTLKSDENRVIIKSKIQLQKLSEKIDELEQFIDKKEFSKLKLNLEKIIWEKISTDYSTEDVERDIYKTFLKRKEAINNQLPEKYQVEIESEYSL